MTWPLIIRRYFFQDDWSILTIQEIINEILQPSLWFLPVLYLYCVLFIGNAYLKNTFGKAIYWIMISILLLIFWHFTGICKNAAIYIIYFAAGAIINNSNKLFAYIFGNKFLGTVAIMSICLLLGFWTSSKTSVLNIILKVIISFSVIIVTYLICSKVQWNNKISDYMEMCGKYSLAIYVVHWIFLPIVPSKILYTQNEILALITFSIVAILISYVCIGIKKLISFFPVLDILMFGYTGFLRRAK